VPHNLNISFAYVEGESMIMAIKDLAVSSGSACTSASLEPSYVLRALGRNDELAHSSIRFSIGRFTTEEEIDYAINLLHEKVRQAARTFAAVGNGQGRHRSQYRPVGCTLKHYRLTILKEKQHGYSVKVIDHYENPAQRRFLRQGRRRRRHRHGRRAGLRRRDEAADQGNKAGVIEDAKFKTYGCGSAIASVSLVTEWVKGKTVDQALDDQEHPDRRRAGAAAG
jgi:hypothetical protein